MAALYDPRGQDVNFSLVTNNGVAALVAGCRNLKQVRRCIRIRQHALDIAFAQLSVVDARRVTAAVRAIALPATCRLFT